MKNRVELLLYHAQMGSRGGSGANGILQEVAILSRERIAHPAYNPLPIFQIDVAYRPLLRY